jgi:hypothetical protein
VVAGKAFLRQREVVQSIEKMAHGLLSLNGARAQGFFT